MYNYRITKYNPKFRNKKGWYMKDEWTEFRDIGKKFGGKILTSKEYMKVEDAYVQTLISFLSEADLSAMAVNRIQNAKNTLYEGKLIKRNQKFGIKDLENIFRLILREKLWCKFKNRDGSYVDFGWDYYCYIGVPKLCKKSQKLARELKLYVEKYSEPVLD